VTRRRRSGICENSENRNQNPNSHEFSYNMPTIKNDAPSLIDRLIGVLLFLLRPFWVRRGLTLTALVVAGSIAGALALWNHVRTTVAAREVYRLDASEIHITPPPPWIRTDVRAEVIRDAGLAAGLSILDDGLVERVQQAFSLHPWVAKVERVTKRHPAHIDVEIVYRKPAAMVKVADGLYPVDAEGVLLPSEDFSPLETRNYPRLTGVESTPQGLTGTRWGDPIVAGGAKIGEALAPLWTDLQLQAIHWLKPGAGGDASLPAMFELATAGGNRIVWGAAPGSESAGEPTAEQKVERLKNFLAQHGSLDDPTSSPDQLDLRRLAPAPRTATRPSL
jgi:hypothetical protein